MIKATQPIQYIHIDCGLVNTIKDGEFFILMAVDNYSRFAFPPQICKEIDEDVLNKLFTDIFKKFKPDIHAHSTTFVANLPTELESTIKIIIGDKHKLVFDEKEAKAICRPVFKAFNTH